MRQYSPNGSSSSGHVKEAFAILLKRVRTTITVLSLSTFAALIAGCGSGGGGGGTAAGVSPQVVSGVAATGSPLVGQVTLRDASSKDKSSNLASDGAFAIDVSDMTAPFVLKATGTADGVDRTLFSFADKPGIANVNPLTTVVLAHAAGVDDPASVFDKPDSATLAKVKSNMASSVATVQTKLTPLLSAFSVASTNPVNAPFTADHSGLDAVFDNVRVVLANGTLTITNATTGAVLFTAQLNDIEHGRFTDNDDDVPKPGPRPPAPTGVTAVGGDGQVTVSWDTVANATSYDLFYSTKSRVAEEEDNDEIRAMSLKDGDSKDGGDDNAPAIRVKNVTSPFVIKGLAPSTTYFVVVRAINNGRRGPPSAEVSATTTAVTPAPVIPAAPVGVSATGGTRQVTLNWNAVSGATSYNLYFSTTTGVTTANGTKISGIASPPVVHTGLADNTTYFYVVTAVNSAGESAASAQVQATTLAANSTTTTSSTTSSSTAATTTTSTTAGATTSTAATTTTTTAGGGTTSTAPTTTTSTTSTTSTSTTTTSTTSTTLALNGAALYGTNCANCHNALANSEHRGASVADINNGIANVSSMRNGILATNGGIPLTQAQIAAISAALQ
jgi:mono/diheme cytochrome c family protein